MTKNIVNANITSAQMRSNPKNSGISKQSSKDIHLLLKSGREASFQMDEGGKICILYCCRKMWLIEL